MTVLIVVETALLLVLSVLVAGLLRAYADVLRRLHRLDGGTEESSARRTPPLRTVEGVPEPRLHAVDGRREWASGHDIDGVTLTGEIVHIRTSGTAHDTLLAFLSSGCSGCAGFWEELGGSALPALHSGARVVVVTKSPDDESRGLLEQLCPPGVDLVMSSQAWSAYDVPGSPFVVVVDGRTGRIKGEGSGSSFTQMASLVAQAAGDLPANGIRKPASDAAREADVDQILRAAGIAPGHPSLYVGSQTHLPGTGAERP